MNNFEFDRMYTFIYHTDMVKADRFYRELLGLEAELVSFRMAEVI